MARWWSILWAGAVLLVACDVGNPTSTERQEAIAREQGSGEVVTPPFDVRGEAEGLLLVWFDAEGTHAAQKRSDIPEASRGQVRVDSLAVAPERRLDPELVYIADMRAPGGNGAYVVRTLPRVEFEALVDRASGTPVVAENTPNAQNAQQANTSGDIIIYGADWCGACQAAARFLRSRQVPFVERNVEQDPSANAEMQRKAAAAGIRPNGIPVIDFRGTILTGFDPQRMDQLLQSTSRPI